MAQHDQKKGAWVVVTGEATIIENSELRALRTAVIESGTVEFVEWGQSVGAKPAAPVSAKPVYEKPAKAEPSASTADQAKF